MPRLTLNLFGGFDARVAGRLLPRPSKRGQILLAYLAISPDRHPSRDKLANLLWEDRSEQQARTSLRQELTSLRHWCQDMGAEWVCSEGDTVYLGTQSLDLDTTMFMALAAETAANALAEAAALYRGPLLDGLNIRGHGFEGWLRAERQRYHEQALNVLAKLLDIQMTSENVEAGIATAHQLLSLDPLQEVVTRKLMKLYDRHGRPGTALQQYEICREILRQELQVKPEPETEQLYETIRAQRSAPASASKTPPPSDLPLPDRPSIAVLPFLNLANSPEQQYFSDGFTEDIITELSRFRSIFVIARNSSFAYRDRAIDMRQIGRELGVRFLVEGSVRPVGDTIRITAQLIDAASGNHIWAERYDRPIKDLFAIQDEVAQTIVATIAERLEDAGIGFAKRRRTDNLPAYDCLLRGIEHARGYTADDNRKAQEMFERAIALDPDFALAHAYLALALLMIHRYDKAPEAIKQSALAKTQHALRLDPNESRCHQFAGQCHLFLCQYDEALSHMRQSVALNPNDANGSALLGLVLAYVGAAEEGVALVRRAMRMNPFHPPWYWTDLSIACYAARRYEESLEAGQHLVDNKTAWWSARRAACYAQLDRLTEARAAAAEALRLDPTFRLSTEPLHYKNPADSAHVHEGMRKAGIPD